jgi:hypothetical protein
MIAYVVPCAALRSPADLDHADHALFVQYLMTLELLQHNPRV